MGVAKDAFVDSIVASLNWFEGAALLEDQVPTDD